MDEIDNEGVSMKTRDRIIALHKRGLANTEIAQVVGWPVNVYGLAIPAFLVHYR